jgi:hypothetical protein
MTAGPSKIPLNVVPLIAPDEVKAPKQRGEAMRTAILQVMTDLAIERVRPEERSPLFDAARDLLTQAGRSPVEMLDAVEPGPEQDALFEELGLRREAGE